MPYTRLYKYFIDILLLLNNLKVGYIMNIIVAVNNRSIEKYLSESKEANVLKVIKSKRGLVSDILELNPHIVVLSNTLKGSQDMMDIIKELNSNETFTSRIVFLYNEDDLYRKKFTNFLIDNGVFDYHVGAIDEDIINELLFNSKNIFDVKHEVITEDEEIEIIKVEEEKQKLIEEIRKEIIEEKVSAADTISEDEIDELIQVEKELEVHFIERIEEIEKIKEVKVPQFIRETIEKKIVITQRQQIITFFSVDDIINSADVLTQFTALLGIKSQQKVLVIDANIIIPVIHHFMGVDKEILVKDVYNTYGTNTGLKAVYDAIEKNIFFPEILEEFVVKNKKLNIDVLTGLYDMPLSEKFNESHFNKLLNAAIEIYDTIIIHAYNDIYIDVTIAALERATQIACIAKPNFTSARCLISTMKYLNDVLKLPKSKFKIIIDGLSNRSLDKEDMKSLFKGYEVISCLPRNLNRESFINKQNDPFVLSSAAKKDLINYLEMVEYFGYIPKISFIDKIFRRKKISEGISSEGKENN